MTIPPHHHTLSGLSKGLVIALAAIFAVAVIILIISATSAATVTGSAPSLAISLANEINTGILGPGEQRWFKLTPSSPGPGAQVEQSLTLFFVPAVGHHAEHVALQLFDEGQLPLYYQGNAGQMVNFGAGRPVSRDTDPHSGELVWNGWLFDGQHYYIQLLNGSESAIDYWLLMDDVDNFPLGEADRQPGPPPTQAPVQTGADSPHTASPLAIGLTQREVAPGHEVWYSFSIEDGDGEYFEEMALTLFATPNDHGQADRLTIDIFSNDEVQKWSALGSLTLQNIGAGSLVHRDDDPLTSERFWTGWLVDGQLYYVRIRNEAEIQVGYWLFTDDVYYPELGRSSK